MSGVRASSHALCLPSFLKLQSVFVNVSREFEFQPPRENLEHLALKMNYILICANLLVGIVGELVQKARKKAMQRASIVHAL